LRCGATPQAVPDWEREWRSQFGADALRLVAPEDEVGFFQPPLDPGKNRSAMTLSDIDFTFTKLEHAVKSVTVGTAEEVIFTLWSGLWGLSVAKWNGGTRQGPSVVLPSDDGTLAGEVRHLIAAYDMLATEPPMLYWLLLGQVPLRLMDAPPTEAVWRAVLPALGSFRPCDLPIGQALAQTAYPEMRVRQLLTATGGTLVALVAEVVRWLAVHGASAVDLATLAALALADGLGDEPLRAVLRQQVAMSWVRAQAREGAA
jgi:hypothetical protein